jgi:acyl-CoA synthetase (AMP-forming)/AMP-acid ligase II
VSRRLEEVVRARAGASAYWFRGESLSYAQFGNQVNRAADAFAGLGVAPGERVGVLTRNRPEYFVASQAIWRAGAVLVPVNVLLSVDEVVHIVRDAGVRALVVSDELAPLAEAACARVPGVVRVLLDAPDAPPGPGAVRWAPMVARADERAPARRLGPERLAVIAYTSGTTGFPKGAMLDDRHLADAMANIAEHLSLSEKDNFLQVFPVHSVAPGLIGGWLTAWIGAECAILERFDVPEIAEVVPSRRVACFAMVPTMLHDLLGHEFDGEPDFSSVRYIQAGGAAVPDRIRTALAERWNIEMIKSYGSTECSYVSLDHPGVEPPPGASGQVLAHIELTVRGPDGRNRPEGEVGELCVGGAPGSARPFRPILGYWNDPAKSAEVLAGGVFHTGDLGRVTPEGFVYVVDRLKDMIIRGGNNIYPAELERVLQADPRVADAYVVGVADERLGEIPKAYIVPSPEVADASAEEIVALANRSLARHKRIETAEFIAPDQLPRNAMNKVLKRELAARANTG